MKGIYLPDRLLLRLRGVLTLILSLSLGIVWLYSGWQQFRQSRDQSTIILQQGTGMDRWAERLTPLLPLLPPGGVIGYLSERDLPGLEFDPIDQEEEFAMSQFLLAPRLLVEGAGEDYILGNFAGPTRSELQALVEPLGLEVQAAFPYGIFFLRKAQP